MMKAAWFEAPGGAADVMVIGEKPIPVPKEKEVLVRLYASGVNPSDVKKRAGLQPAGLDQAGFVIPHSDGAGIIEAVGKGVDSARVGQRVWVYQAQYGRHLGTAAEYVCVPDVMAPLLPEEADFKIGACIGIPMMTAHRCVFSDGNVDGKTVLVTGASGRVGHYAVQWAKLGGADRVIATAGNDEGRRKIAESSGADLVLDYTSDDLADQILSGSDGKGVDRIVEVEFGANLGVSTQVLKTGGVIASYASSSNPEPKLPFYPMMFNNISLQMILVYNMSAAAKQQAVTDIQAALTAERLTHRIATSFALKHTANAHEAIEQGGQAGCVVIDID